MVLFFWWSKKKYETSRSISKAKTRAIYTVVLDKNWIRKLYISIGYPIWPPSKLYENNQATIKRVLSDIITLQSRPLVVLVVILWEICLRKSLDMVDTRSNTQLSDINSKPRGGKIIRDIINQSIGVCFYPPPWSENYKLFVSTCSMDLLATMHNHMIGLTYYKGRTWCLDINSCSGPRLKSLFFKGWEYFRKGGI